MAIDLTIGWQQVSHLVAEHGRVVLTAFVRKCPAHAPKNVTLHHFICDGHASLEWIVDYHDEASELGLGTLNTSAWKPFEKRINALAEDDDDDTRSFAFAAWQVALYDGLEKVAAMPIGKKLKTRFQLVDEFGVTATKRDVADWRREVRSDLAKAKKPLPKTSAKQRFEFRAGSSRKFWEISRTGSTLKVSIGRLGTTGQEKLKRFDSDRLAQAALEQLLDEKTAKGYQSA